MAGSGVLYMKGMNGMESDEIEEEEDIWDDTKLNDAYDKAVKMANLEVARRVAMATNSTDRKKEKSAESSQTQQNQPSNPRPKKSKQSKAKNKAQKKESNHSWKEGMPCRAMYSVDGFDYEATLLTILDDDSCVIRYLGYNNIEIVPLSSLQPTLGKQARADQMAEASAGRDEDASSTHSTFMDHDFTEPRVKGAQSSSKLRTVRNKRPELRDSFTLPHVNMPDVSSVMREFGGVTPPPPPLFPGGGLPEDPALNDMLMSWYMSGYYTGLYQGMKRLKQRHRNC